jgi:hypothetical protein
MGEPVVWKQEDPNEALVTTTTDADEECNMGMDLISRPQGLVQKWGLGSIADFSFDLVSMQLDCQHCSPRPLDARDQHCRLTRGLQPAACWQASSWAYGGIQTRPVRCHAVMRAPRAATMQPMASMQAGGSHS